MNFLCFQIIFRAEIQEQVNSEHCKMRWSAFLWLAILAAVVILESSKANAAPSPQAEDMLKALLELDRKYSSIARPR